MYADTVYHIPAPLAFLNVTMIVNPCIPQFTQQIGGFLVEKTLPHEKGKATSTHCRGGTPTHFTRGVGKGIPEQQ